MTGQTVHGGEDLLEVLPLDLEQLGEGRLLVLGLAGEDHAAHDREAVLGQEHVLGTAQADALGAELTGPGGVGAGVGVGPHAEAAPADLVGPAEDDGELGGHVALDEADLAGVDAAGRPVDGDPLPLGDHDAGVGLERVAPHGDALGAAHRRLAPATGHDGGVADEPPARGEDPLCHGHAVHVVGRGLLAHEHDALTALDGRDGGVGVEVDAAHRGTR